MSTNRKPATSRQLQYLRALAARTGTTFTTPRTTIDASREIKRLLQIHGHGDSFAEQETTAMDKGSAARRSSDVQPGEITGHGSNAHWGSGESRQRKQDRELPTPAQREYLHKLSKQRGRNYSVPASRTDAARKIAWLKNGATGPEPADNRAPASHYDGLAASETWGAASPTTNAKPSTAAATTPCDRGGPPGVLIAARGLRPAE